MYLGGSVSCHVVTANTCFFAASPKAIYALVVAFVTQLTFGTHANGYKIIGSSIVHIHTPVVYFKNPSPPVVYFKNPSPIYTVCIYILYVIVVTWA